VNLGPISPTIQNVPSNPQSNGFGLNPRCLRRAISIQNAKGTTTDYTYQLLTASRNSQILAFQNEMQGYFPDGMIGVHGGGHFTTGGDPGGDFYTSPGDPIFWLHQYVFLPAPSFSFLLRQA
jgi:tyrosinase